MTSGQARKAVSDQARVWSPWVVLLIQTAKVVSSLTIIGTALLFMLGPGADMVQRARIVLEEFPAFRGEVGSLKDQNQRLEAAVATLGQRQERLLRAVEVLSAPADVVDFYAAGVTGPCPRTEGCTVEFELARVPGATECRIMRDTVDHVVISDADRVFRTPFMQPIEGRNIDSTRQAVELRIRSLPSGIPLGPATYWFTAEYTGCSWQIDGDPPVVQRSPPVAIIVTE